MKPITKKLFNRVWMALLLAGLSMVSVTASLSANTYKIGDIHGGGKVAYIFQPGDSGYVEGQQHGLIAAEADISTEYKDGWDNDTHTGVYVWSTGQYKVTSNNDYAYHEITTTGTAIGDGAGNTMKILAKYPIAIYPNSAAAVAHEYRGGGYSDWFLPSMNELKQLYLNKGLVGGFADFIYWSSSEMSSSAAWYYIFVNGLLSDSVKSYYKRVRPVRVF
ncbi:MAG: DUF1566 domain-containing protein [Chlorobium limicola]|uniref:Vir region protein-like protein n=1 Tax=Chlorobium limicola (strain DSM 245 / NBRC 103803 / 6330) TaxID=290315 RepID=B3EHM9_CHLL2|nr:DUF1566 domain-containing protein [Chlorobium limicola]ACD89809.1 vir region protein-like protein [Chlorobium limicola DSM 245]NTV19759.1 DUF1566 domain-containing protein [Chlorobium limicola]